MGKNFFLDNFNILDVYGVNFEFRMKEYRKFKSKTGACCALILILICLNSAIVIFTDYLDNPSIELIGTNINKSYIKWDKMDTKILLYIPLSNVSKYYELSSKIIIQNSVNRTILFYENNGQQDILLKDCYKNLKSDIEEVRGYYKDLEKLGTFYCLDFKKLNPLKYHIFFNIEIKIKKKDFEKYVNELKKEINNESDYVTVLLPSKYEEISSYVGYQEKIITNILFETIEENKDLSLSSLFPKKETNFFLEYKRHEILKKKDEFYHEIFYLNNNISEKYNDSTLNNDTILAEINLIPSKFVTSQYFKTNTIFKLFSAISNMFVNMILTFKVIFVFINLIKAKIHILKKFFKIDFSQSHFEGYLVERKKFRLLKNNLVNCIENLKQMNQNNEKNKCILYKKKRYENSNISKLFDENQKKSKEKMFSIRNRYLLRIRNSSKFKLEDKNFTKSIYLEKDKNIGSYYHKIKDEIVELTNIKNENNMELDLNNFRCDSSLNINHTKIINPNSLMSNLPNDVSVSTRQLFQKDFIESIDLKNNALNYSQKEKNLNEINYKIEIKNSRDSNFQIEKNNITIKRDKTDNINDKKKEKLNLRRIICYILTCQITKLKNSIKIFKEAETLFNKYFDIEYYISRMNEIELIKSFILNHNQRVVFEFLSQPSFNFSYLDLYNVDIDNNKFDNKTINDKNSSNKLKDLDNLAKCYQGILNDDNEESIRLKMMFEKRIYN